MPVGADLHEAYADVASADYVEEEEGQRATARDLLELLERHVDPGALLDLGCWVGFLLDEARARGWRPTGVEPSRVAADFARDRLGLPIVEAPLEAADLAPGAFDAIVMADVIEHLPDPGAALDRAAALLAPGGALLLVLPDAGSRVARVLGRRWWSVIPTHVQYFTRRSLPTLLARHGWRVLEGRTAPKAFSVRYYLGRAGGYSPALGRALVRAGDRRGVGDPVGAGLPRPDDRGGRPALAVACRSASTSSARPS